ncbi:MAG: hypothetical protein ACI9BW_000970, partial [Gammaproteobacteria bacterium]
MNGKFKAQNLKRSLIGTAAVPRALLLVAGHATTHCA